MKSVRLYTLLTAIFALIAGTYTNSYAQEAPDTLLKTDKPSRIVITESSAGSVISVRGIGEDDTFQTTVNTDYPENASVTSTQSVKYDLPIQLPGIKTNSRGWTCFVNGITLGLSNPTGIGGNGGLQWSKSIEVGWLECLAVGYSWGNTSLGLGLGFDWRNYKITTSDRYLTTSPSKGIEWAEAGSLPEGSILKSSRLKVFSLQLPLLFRARIPNSSVRLKIGPIFNFNTHASILTRYTDNYGNDNELFTKDLNQRIFTLDFFGSVSIRGIVGVYVRYSPMKVMNGAEGINFRPLTIGIGIGI